MNGNKKLLVPVMALMLCAVAVIGVGYAYTGTYSDTSSSADMDVHWVKAGSSAQIKIDATGYKVDVDTVTSGYGSSATTTYALSTTQSHGDYNPADKTVTFEHVKIGTLSFAASDDGATTGTLAITLSNNDASGVKVVLNGTYTAFDTSATMDIYVDIIVSQSAVSGGSSTISTPAFTMNVVATATA